MATLWAQVLRTGINLVMKNNSFVLRSLPAAQPTAAIAPQPTVAPAPAEAVAPSPVQARNTVQAATTSENDRLVKPGCIAGDETVHVHGYLERLARGNGGFGILKEGHERMGRAARGAEQFGRPDLAAKLREVQAKLPDIHDAAAAAAVRDTLDPLVDDAWQVAIQCGAVTGAMWERAEQLARDVNAGDLTEDQARDTLRTEFGIS